MNILSEINPTIFKVDEKSMAVRKVSVAQS